jgi:hypothetical protein
MVWDRICARLAYDTRMIWDNIGIRTT